jgi:hypothetical protein
VSNSKHTPGPWAVVGAIPTHHSDIEAVSHDGYPITVAKSVSDKGNARLIAAAPDLLAALKKIWEAVIWLDTSKHYEAAIRRIAHAAIQKAEGKE